VKLIQYIVLFLFLLKIGCFMRRLSFLLLILLTLAVAPSMQSCYKEPGPGTARIIVIDENKLRVPYATVRLVNGNVNLVGSTDFEGIAEFNNKLEVILNVEAKKQDKIGTGIARIRPGETITEVITIY
jgi:hypothetical protein